MRVKGQDPPDETIEDILKKLFDVVHLSISDLLAVADSKYRFVRNDVIPKKWPKFLIFLIHWPFTILYAVYVYLPLLMVGHLGRHMVLFLQVACHRSRLTRKLVIHLAALCKIGIKIINKVMTTKISVIVSSILQTVVEYFWAWNAPRNSPKKARSITHLVELLEYTEEEGEERAPNSGPMRRRSKEFSPRGRKLPTNPFRARVRISNSSSSVATQGSLWSNRAFVRGSDADASSESDTPESRNSFPYSPESRARHMSCSELEADSVVFYARDKLRLETQSVSSDVVSREAASRMLRAGRNIAFDPRFSPPDTYLACGNHYVLKMKSNGSCSSCRASIPVLQGIHVYLEFSITAQSEDNPSSFVTGPVNLSVGLIPADCPPNVGAGQWPHSIGLYSNGQFLVGGKECEYRPLSGTLKDTVSVTVTASTTIGMLIFVPKPSGKARITDKSIQPPPSLAMAEIPDIDLDLDDIDTLGVDYVNNYSSKSIVEISNTTDSEQDMLSNLDLPYSVTYNVNGKVVEMAESAHAEVSSSLEARHLGGQLYPVVSLMSKNSGSWCRFCESDVVYRSRRDIGAPLGHRVYCMDGSVLLEPDN